MPRGGMAVLWEAVTMATTKLLTYTLPEVCEMLGIDHEQGKRLIKKKEFPFPVIQVGSGKGEKSMRYLIARKVVDDFMLDGKNTHLTDAKKQGLGRPRRWEKGEFVNWNMRIPVELAEAFNFIVDQINKSTASPLTYGDARLLAFQEFIERRPVKTK